MEQTPKEPPVSPAAPVEPTPADRRYTPEQVAEFQRVFAKRVKPARSITYLSLAVLLGLIYFRSWEWYVAIVAVYGVVAYTAKCPGCRNLLGSGWFGFAHCPGCTISLNPANRKIRGDAFPSGVITDGAWDDAVLERDSRARRINLLSSAVAGSAIALLVISAAKGGLFPGMVIRTVASISVFLVILWSLVPRKMTCPACTGRFYVEHFAYCPYCLCDYRYKGLARTIKHQMPFHRVVPLALGVVLLTGSSDNSWLNRIATGKGFTSHKSELDLACFARMGDAEGVSRRIEQGEDPNSVDEYGRTPLEWAIMYKKSEVIGPLVNAGADPNRLDKHGWRPLQFAVTNRDLETVKALLANGADINGLSKNEEKWLDGETALYEASGEDTLEIFNFLISKGADPNAGKGCNYPLTYSDNPAIAKVLLDIGAKVNGRDDCDETPLMEAVLRGDKEMVKLLIAAGSRLDAPVPLESRKSEKTIDCAEVKAKGGDVEESDCEWRLWGKSPLQIARQEEYDEIETLLLAAGAKE